MRSFCLVIFLSLSNLLIAQDPPFWQITDEQGLPSMTVYKIRQDSKGFMWIGTAAGLCSYDGKKFEYYRHPDQLDDEIIFMKIDDNDRIWYSNLSGQIFYLENEKVIQVSTKEFTSQFVLHNLYFVNDEIILVTWIKEPGEYLTFYTNLKEPIKAIENWGKSKSKSLVISHDKTANETLIGKVEPQNISLFLEETSNVTGKNLEKILAKSKIVKFELIAGLGRQNLIYDNSEEKFFIKSNNTLYIFNLKTQKKEQFNFKTPINSILKLENELWLAMRDEGINILKKDGKITSFFKSQGFNFLMSDHEGNIWAATSDNGIYIIPSHQKLHSNTDNSPLKSNKIQLLLPDSVNKRMIVAGLQGHFFEARKTDLNFLLKVPKLANVTSGIKVNNDWILGGDRNIAKVNFSKLETTKFWQKIPNKTLHIDHLNNLWIGNSLVCIKTDFNKLDLLENSEFYKEKRSAPIIPKRTYSILTDYQNTVWIGTTGGLYSYDHSSEVTSPVLENGNHPQYRFTSIIQSPYDSSIWAATHGDGVLRIKDNVVIEHFSTKNHLASNICNDLFADNSGNIWIATNQGTAKYNSKSNSFETIDKYDGLPTNEITNVAVLGNTVYLGTNKGLITFSNEIETKNITPPPVYISKIAISEKDTFLLEKYSLPYFQNTIQVDFVGIGYKCRGNIKYKYRMLGIDSSWVTTETRFARFPGLSPGKYEFQVFALNEDNIESTSPKIVQFEITPPFWQTGLFRLLAIIGSVFAIGLIFNLRYQRLQKQEKLKQEFKDKVNELTAQALQTQMNPHFIFNSLNAIQHFLTTNDQENAMIYMSRFAKLIRHIFEQSKEKTITLRQELDFLNLYVSLEKLRFKDKVSVDFQVDEHLMQMTESIELPPLLIQPIVENAFKHGLFHKTKHGHLTIDFSFEKDFFKILIEDDGIGRKKSGEINLWRKGNHQSSGVNSTRERILLLNNENSESEVLNDLKITDLFNSASEPIGTRVEIILLLKLID